jgi:hypothetical protein
MWQLDHGDSGRKEEMYPLGRYRFQIFIGLYQCLVGML